MTIDACRCCIILEAASPGGFKTAVYTAGPLHYVSADLHEGVRSAGRLHQGQSKDAAREHHDCNQSTAFKQILEI